MTPENPLQPVQRQVVAVLARDHMGQHPRARQAVVDRLQRLVGVITFASRSLQAYLNRTCSITYNEAGSNANCSLTSSPIRKGSFRLNQAVRLGTIFV